MAMRDRGISGWIRRALKEEPPRSKSLMVTIFGDSITPYAPGLWLRDLIALLQPFHVNERLVRTSAFRLSEEGWLESKREGRRSRYSLTLSGQQRIENASHRIYHSSAAAWDGSWTFLIQNKTENSAVERVELRRELEWEGFGVLRQGIFVHPCADVAAVREVLERLRLAGSVTAMRARGLDSIASAPVGQLVGDCWNLRDLAKKYEEFLRRFEPVLPLLLDGLVPLQGFVVQTLLIHSFRRVTLHDPLLPAELLPADLSSHLEIDAPPSGGSSGTNLGGYAEPAEGTPWPLWRALGFLQIN